MPIEYEVRNGNLVWIKNPITGVVSYVVDLSAKNFAFTLGGGGGAQPSDNSHPAVSAEQIRDVTAGCPFCPGNEHLSPRELIRAVPEQVAGWQEKSGRDGAPWVIRAFNNLFPRIPDELTGNRNESYVVVEDPRHFVDEPRSLDDFLFSGALGEEHFFQLLALDADVARRSLSNPAVRSVVIRKNQGRQSGASQPHPHQQIIGSPTALPALEAEARAQRENPAMWREVIELTERFELMLTSADGVISYASPIGTFPRSYDVIIPEFRGLITELSRDQLKSFARALHQILRILGPLPLDYEIHQGHGLPLHAHVNARIYPYSNVAGTLNLPSSLIERTAAARHVLKRR
jgi:UDPglucose--hexose-1-phosphate uridylyltransferase